MVKTSWTRTAVVVGAGATVAEALPGKPPRHRLPPLDGTFFELCGRLTDDGGSALTKYLEREYGMNPFKLRPGMEEVFNLLYSDTHAARNPDAAVEAYWALLRLYRRAIRETTNPLEGTSRRGVGKLLRALYGKDQPDRRTNIITFNQDLVIEKALEAMRQTAAYGHVGWGLDLGYGTEFKDFLEPATRGAPFSMKPPGDTHIVRILKLHGSLNWVHPVRSASDARNALRDPPDQLYCLNDSVVRAELRMSGERRAQTLLPFIVPPIFEKSVAIRAFLRPLWMAAHGALRIAQEVIFFGYSLPPADVASLGMLKRAYYQNADRPPVTVIDVSAGVAARIADALHPPTLRFYRSVEDFCQDMK